MDAREPDLSTHALRERWEEFRRAGEVARELAGSLSHEQLWWRPPPTHGPGYLFRITRWSVGECLDHLGRERGLGSDKAGASGGRTPRVGDGARGGAADGGKAQAEGADHQIAGTAGDGPGLALLVHHEATAGVREFNGETAGVAGVEGEHGATG